MLPFFLFPTLWLLIIIELFFELMIGLVSRKELASLMVGEKLNVISRAHKWTRGFYERTFWKIFLNRFKPASGHITGLISITFLLWVFLWHKHFELETGIRSEKKWKGIMGSLYKVLRSMLSTWKNANIEIKNQSRSLTWNWSALALRFKFNWANIPNCAN